VQCTDEFVLKEEVIIVIGTGVLLPWNWLSIANPPAKNKQGSLGTKKP
jgi:hypothetical protein